MHRRSWKAWMSRPALTVAAAVLNAAGVGAFLAFTRGGGEPPPRPQATRSAAPSRLLAPARFATVVADPRVVTMNVHVPDEGSLPGTDLEIPYDRVEARRAELPRRSTRLAIYCRSGRMSAIAARTLARLGFTRISELSGGMLAWERSGRRLLPPRRAA
jgi:rhodanese-related sulfurtransferase